MKGRAMVGRASNPQPSTRWQTDAACQGLDTELFFPGRGEHTAITAAKEICRSCAIRDECLESALAAGEKFGIWGGTSERERRVLRRQRAAASCGREVA